MASTRGWLWTALPVLILGLQLHAATAAAQQTPAAGTNNSCIFAHDGECDETSGTCAAGTDSADCRPGAAADPANSCRFAFDHRCDEPGKGSGHCAAGTDTADCAAAAAPAAPVQIPDAPAQTPAPAAGPGDDSCPFAKDHDCDEPVIGSGACAAGTDTTDCKARQGGGVPTQPPAPAAPQQSAPPPDAADGCPFARDGECDEPGIGSGACNAGTDTTDCKAKRGDLPVPASPTPPSGASNDSCPFAKDGECDEPGIGSGACTAGTDATDCKAHPAGQTPAVPAPPAASGDDSCQFAKDHECDDPDGGTGLCAPDTDVTDCRAGAVSPAPATPAPPAAPTPPAGDKTWSGPADSCEFAHDGECDEPGKGTGLCSAGTDTADCSAAGGTPNRSSAPSSGSGDSGAAAPAACPFTKDGDCDEPGKGTGLCAAGTDVDDCRGK